MIAGTAAAAAFAHEAAPAYPNFGLPRTEDMMFLVLQIGVIIFAAKVGGALASLLKLPSILGELAAGIVIGPWALGGIPILNSERAEDAPIVVAGGPCAFNPEPLADIIDAFMVGDGEEQIVELNQVIREWKKSGEPRETCLKKLAAVRGVYVPSLYDVTYNADGTIASFGPNCPEAPERVVKAIITDLDTAFFPEKIPVPYTEIIHDRIMLEIMRGCTRGCRFCQAGMLYRPVRERSLETLVRQRAQVPRKSYGTPRR